MMGLLRERDFSAYFFLEFNRDAGDRGDGRNKFQQSYRMQVATSGFLRRNPDFLIGFMPYGRAISLVAGPGYSADGGRDGRSALEAGGDGDRRGDGRQSCRTAEARVVKAKTRIKKLGTEEENFERAFLGPVGTEKFTF